MNSRDESKFANLWQFPLLVVSAALFGVAAWLFIHPHNGSTVEDKIDVAAKFLAQERPDAALAQLNTVLTTEKLDTPREGKVHLMMARSLEMGQKQLKIAIPANFRRIVEQTRLSLGAGTKLSAADYQRLGESEEALALNADALQSYRQAMALDADHALHLQRKVIDLQLDQDDDAGAENSLQTYLNDKSLTSAERGWALNQRAGLLIDQDRFVEAKVLLDDALKLATDSVRQGEVNYRLGYCAYKLGDENEAERYLRVARDQLQVRHPLDGDACYYLGQIYQHRDDPATANSFYETVLTSHIDSKIMPLARLGRGMCRLMQKNVDAGLSDLQEFTNEVSTKLSRAKLVDPGLEGLKKATALLSARQDYQSAIETLANEQTLAPKPDAAFFERLGGVFEHRADQLEATLETVGSADRIKRGQQAREMRTRAGDAYVAYSQRLTLLDDKGYGDALWHGIDLYDKAAALPYAISALELFVAERPEDKLAPDATLRLGRAYQAQGQFDKAITAFQTAQSRYPQSLAASKSAIPLAQAYVAKGPAFYSKAETTLKSVVENNALVDPQAEEFRQALFELAQLYYRTSRFEEAIARLEEYNQRYASDSRRGQLLFLMADSYRKSAGLLDGRLASASGASGIAAIADLTEVTAAKRDRLTRAKEYFDKVVDTYADKMPQTDVEKLDLKLASFYRGDCLYDLGNYADAIKLYDQAATQYAGDPSVLSAYVQIVNAYCAMGKMDQARAANERAKLLLRSIPPEAFTDGTFSMPKSYWEQALKWTGDSGMWSMGDTTGVK